MKNNSKKKIFKKKNSKNIKEEWTRLLEKSSSRGIAVIRNGKVIGAGVNFAKMVGYNYTEVGVHWNTYKRKWKNEIMTYSVFNNYKPFKK